MYTHRHKLNMSALTIHLTYKHDKPVGSRTLVHLVQVPAHTSQSPFLTPFGPVKAIVLVDKSRIFVDGKTWLRRRRYPLLKRWSGCGGHHVNYTTNDDFCLKSPWERTKETHVNILFSAQRLKMEKGKPLSYICVLVTVQWWWLVDNVGSGFAAEDERSETKDHFVWNKRLKYCIILVCG